MDKNLSLLENATLVVGFDGISRRARMLLYFVFARGQDTADKAHTSKKGAISRHSDFLTTPMAARSKKGAVCAEPPELLVGPQRDHLVFTV